MTSRRRSRTRTRGRAIGGGWALALVLVGLFGMHGLASHDAHEAGTNAAMVEMGWAGTSPAPTAPLPRPVVTGPITGPAHSSSPGGLPMGSMGGLCLAVLGTALLLMLLRLRAPRAWLTVPWPRAVKCVVRRGRDPAPASPAQLSLLRC